MSDLTREEFEAWTANHDYLGGVELDRTISGNYADIDMQHAWQSWQASREYLVIELPIPVDFPDGTGDYHQMIDPDDLIDAIHAAGVKTQ